MDELKSAKPRRGRPVNPQLSDEIICVAGDMFSEMGLHATKMEHIAAKLKISKLTLYSRFKDKEALFAAVIQKKCREFVPERPFTVLDSSEAKSSLTQICFGLMQLLVSEEALGMERMLMALDNNERSNLTRLFYQQGAERVIRLIKEHLAELHHKGILVIEDPIFAADALAALIKGSDICTRVQMHIEPAPTQNEMKLYCDNVVTFFIKGVEVNTNLT